MLRNSVKTTVAHILEHDVKSAQSPHAQSPESQVHARTPESLLGVEGAEKATGGGVGEGLAAEALWTLQLKQAQILKSARFSAGI